MAAVAVAAVVSLSLAACDSSASGQPCKAPGPCFLGQAAIELQNDYSLALGAVEVVDPRHLDGFIDDAVVVRADAAPDDAGEAIAFTAGSYGSLGVDDEFRMTVLVGDGAASAEIDVSRQFAESCDRANGCTIVVVPETMPADLSTVSVSVEYEGGTIEVEQPRQ